MEYRVSVPPVVPLEREIERERERESRRWLGVWCGACPASCPQRVAAVYTSLIAEQVETTECRCGRQMWAHRLPHNPYLVCFTATVILLSMIVRCSKPTIMSHLVHIGSDGASIAVTMAWTILVLIWRLLWLKYTLRFGRLLPCLLPWSAQGRSRSACTRPTMPICSLLSVIPAACCRETGKRPEAPLRPATPRHFSSCMLCSIVEEDEADECAAAQMICVPKLEHPLRRSSSSELPIFQTEDRMILPLWRTSLTHPKRMSTQWQWLLRLATRSAPVCM